MPGRKPWTAEQMESGSVIVRDADDYVICCFYSTVTDRGDDKENRAMALANMVIGAVNNLVEP